MTSPAGNSVDNVDVDVVGVDDSTVPVGNTTSKSGSPFPSPREIISFQFCSGSFVWDVECGTFERFPANAGVDLSKYLLFPEALGKSVSLVDVAGEVGFVTNNSAAAVTTSKFGSSAVAKGRYASPGIEVGPPGIEAELASELSLTEIETKDAAWVVLSSKDAEVFVGLGGTNVVSLFSSG